MVAIEERKQQYIAKIQQINDPTAKRVAILKGMEKLVEEFGNESEKFGIKFGLYPGEGFGRLRRGDKKHVVLHGRG